MAEVATAPVGERIAELDNRCEAIVLERHEAQRNPKLSTEDLELNYSLPKTLGALTSVAYELELMGEEIAVMSNAAVVTRIGAEDRALKLTHQEVFGLVGKLAGFSTMRGGVLAYMFDMSPVTLDGKLASGVITPRGYSAVGAGGLMVPEQAISMATAK